MGECGCCEFNAMVKIETAAGWLILGVYPSCDDCATPVGLEIAEPGDWYPAEEVDDLPVLQLHEGIACHAILDPAKLAAQLAEEGYDVDERSVRRAVRGAVFDTQREDAFASFRQPVPEGPEDPTPE